MYSLLFLFLVIFVLTKFHFVKSDRFPVKAVVVIYNS